MTKERVCAIEEDMTRGLRMSTSQPSDPIYQQGYVRGLDTILLNILELSKIGVATVDSSIRVDLNQGAHGALYEAIGRLASEAVKKYDDSIV